MRLTHFVFLIALLCPSLAFATSARSILTCTSTTTRLEEVTGVGVRESTECAEPATWIDLTVGVQLVALQVTGPRQVVSLGASPSLGVLLAWRPVGWTATPFVIGGELTFAMTLISPELAEGTATHVEIWTVGAVNLLGWFAVGIGGRYGLAVREGLEDFARLVVTAGLRIPL